MPETGDVLVFQEFSRGSSPREQAWVSPGGGVGALFKLGEKSDLETVQPVIERLAELLDAGNVPVDLLGERLLGSFGAGAFLNVLLLIRVGPARLRVLSCGDVQLLELPEGHAGASNVLPPSSGSGFVISEVTFAGMLPQRFIACAADTFDLNKLGQFRSDAPRSDTRNAWNALLDHGAAQPSWACLTFPVLSALSYRVATWKYDPFLGEQEDLPHERRGLAEVATALFKDLSFDGFRILPAPVMFRPKSDRLYDGLLATPWGVFLLELKDGEGKFLLRDQRGPGGLEYTFQDKTERLTNPADKFSADLKKLGSHPAFETLRTMNHGWLLRIGALVFTNPRAVVRAIENGVEREVSAFGAVVVARPETLAARLKEHVCAGSGWYAAHGPIAAEELERVVRAYMGHEFKPTRPVLRRVGLFEFSGAPLEKSSFATTYAGVQPATGRKVWIRELQAMSLVRSSKEREAALAMFRGNVALLYVLPPDPRLQRALDSVEDGHLLYVVLEAVEHPTLDDWLKSAPPRSERLNLLRELGKVLGLLAEHRVTHRALSPSTIRVRPGGEPLLTNFDLCHLDSVATLSADARNALDRAYLAPEADRPGAQITPAADMYSLGRLMCRVLTGELPYATYVQQGTWARSPKAFPELAARCGFEGAEALLLKLLAPAPAQRLTAAELVAWAAAW